MQQKLILNRCLSDCVTFLQLKFIKLLAIFAAIVRNGIDFSITQIDNDVWAVKSTFVNIDLVK